MGFHVKRLNLRIRLLTANDPTATYSWSVCLSASSDGSHAMGVYGLGRSTVVVGIAQMKVKNLKRVCLDANGEGNCKIQIVMFG